MKNLRFHVVCSLLVCAIAALYVAGCQSTSLVQQTAQARTAYTGVIDAVNVELTNGRITRDEWRKYGQPARASARAALDVMDAAATKDPAQWQAAFDQFNQALGELNAAKAKAESVTPAPQSRVQLPGGHMSRAAFDISEIALLLGIAMNTLQKMVAEGRKETTEEETQQLVDARAAQQASDDRLDATLENDQPGERNA